MLVGILLAASFGYLYFHPTAGVRAEAAHLVSVYADGQTKMLATDASTVAEVLERLGVSVSNDDLVEPGLDTTITAGVFNINIYRARPVQVVDGSEQVIINTALQSPSLVAQAAGFNVYPEDAFDVGPIVDFVNASVVGQRIEVKRATSLYLTVDRRRELARTQATTIEQFLSEHKITLGPEDVLSPSKDVRIQPGQEITIKRVKEVVTTLEEVIARPVQTVKDETKSTDWQEVRVAGSDGKKKVSYRINYQDGVETNRQVLSSLVLVEPQTKVVAVGTQIPDNAWYRLRMCEAGGRYDRNSGNGYYGAYQFDISTWNNYGGYYYPHEAPPAVQDAKAADTQARRGWYPWPTCARKLGLI